MAAADAGGEQFGRYLLRDLIGKGGMGQVFRTYDTETGRVVALKVLPASAQTDVPFEGLSTALGSP